MNIIEENWEEILERVQTEHEMTYVSFDTWLKPLKVYSFENNTVSILVCFILYRVRVCLLGHVFNIR